VIATRDALVFTRETESAPQRAQSSQSPIRVSGLLRALRDRLTLDLLLLAQALEIVLGLVTADLILQ
jgi:hypothetical protein